MQNLKKIIIISSLLLILFAGKSFSQDLQAIVDINDQALSTESRERLTEFKRQVEEYLNRNKYHQNPIPPVPCYFTFNFLSTNGFDQYTAQILVVAQREIYRQNKNDPIAYTTTFKFLDERCTFNYSRSMQFVKNDVIFNSLLSLLDYYAYLVVGFDEDSYFPKGGTRYFQKAQDLCNKPISGDEAKGWTETGGGSKPSRLQLVQELLNVSYDDFRKGYFEYHWMGLDSLNIQRANAFGHMLNALEKISNVKKKQVKAFNIDIFFDEKYQEIAETFKNYGNRNIYDKLIQYDPVHRNEYENAKKEAR